jgi:hypothetical protein
MIISHDLILIFTTILIATFTIVSAIALNPTLSQSNPSPSPALSAVGGVIFEIPQKRELSPTLN